MKRLNVDDRMVIQACLTKGMNLSDIAFRLRRSKSTISREISSHMEIREGYKDKPCIHLKENFICNSCRLRNTCTHTKRFYNFEMAERKSKEVRSKSRKKTKLSPSQIKLINDVLLDEVRNLKQSLHHAYIANSFLKDICSERTIRRSIYRGEFDVKCHELRKYVVYKHEYDMKAKFELKDLSVIIGRTYKDYVNYVKDHKRLNVVQYDSVIGKITDINSILTITFPKYEFQFGVLINKGNPRSVNKKIKKIFATIGKDNAKEIFPVNLCDNGIEFSYFNEIEEFNEEKICRVYFTNPYKATDKAECERYHEFIRYFIPKGKSLDFLTEEKVNWMFSQINSMVRKNLNDKSPYDLVERKFGKEFLNKIGIYRVQKKKVTLAQIC